MLPLLGTLSYILNDSSYKLIITIKNNKINISNKNIFNKKYRQENNEKYSKQLIIRFLTNKKIIKYVT